MLVWLGALSVVAKRYILIGAASRFLLLVNVAALILTPLVHPPRYLLLVMLLLSPTKKSSSLLWMKERESMKDRCLLLRPNTLVASPNWPSSSNLYKASRLILIKLVLFPLMPYLVLVVHVYQ